MTQQKNWNKTSYGSYSFSINGVERGSLNVTNHRKEAEARIDGKNFKIKCRGFLKLFLEVLDDAGNTVLKITQDSWLASRWEMLHNFKRYRLVLRNFPLAQYVVTENGKEILSYGLKTQKFKPYLHIESETTERDLLMDFVLWFLYAPIVHESTATGLPRYTSAIAAV
ncbi:MAG: hypothetical protein JST55_14420 [Bacteroidetes bacterium]|nr:hypothetical protein [Bacteroidota bacterium]